MTPEQLTEWREDAKRDQRSGFGLGWPARSLALIDALEGLRGGVNYLARVYAVAPDEPRCCSDCAANDIGDELTRLLNA